MGGGVIRGRIDRSGALVSADAPLLRLQQRAGAGLEKPLALPQLAGVVALAQRLQLDISRPLYAADDHSDIHALVRVMPDADGANLEISDWRTGPVGQPQVPSIPDMAAAPHAWAWECDGQLRLVVLRAGVDAPPVPAGWEGLSLSEQFELQHNAAGRFAVLRAPSPHSRLEGQPLPVLGPHPQAAWLP